jgi:DNA invertase Pin-like site-specific DNA recombinase
MNLNTSEDPEHQTFIPVAQYVRMSTEHQRYSTENQAEAIAAYAQLRGMQIVKTYEDAGKSGLNIRGRSGLQRLLRDVQAPMVPFKAVLVYDISRWGRFPDPDEAAVYEQTCKRRGIKVIYCAEPFTNDGSLSSTVMVGLKRSMAAEYSRELSVKVFAGHRTLVQHGFRQGGAAGFGLRRQLLDDAKRPKGILNPGEKKSLQTDRVLLIPGPAEEVQIVHRIYDMFLDDGMPERVIASALNRFGVNNHHGRPWTRGAVHQVLTNEKYIGNNVYNRTSFKLKIEHKRNAPSEWIRFDGAYEAIVPIERFKQVQEVIAARSARLDEPTMLDMLRKVLAKHGALSGILIDEQENLPSSSAYMHRFGGLLRAYRLVGYMPERDYAYLEINRLLRQRHPMVVKEVVDAIALSGGNAVAIDPKTELLRVNDNFSMSVVIARCKSNPNGSSLWHIRLDAGLDPDITVVVRMDRQNAKAFDYYVLPSIDFSRSALPRREDNGFTLDAYRWDSLDALYQMAGRVSLKEAA